MLYMLAIYLSDLFLLGFTDNANASEEMQVKAHECLGKVLSNLKEVINQYPSLKSDEILAAAGKLISKIKSHNYELNQIPDDFYQSIDQLALVFSSRYVQTTLQLFNVAAHGGHCEEI